MLTLVRIQNVEESDALDDDPRCSYDRVIGTDTEVLSTRFALLTEEEYGDFTVSVAEGMQSNPHDIFDVLGCIEEKEIHQLLDGINRHVAYVRVHNGVDLAREISERPPSKVYHGSHL
jgi:hypothetical protein